jgi:hypothetical protein
MIEIVDFVNNVIISVPTPQTAIAVNDVLRDLVVTLPQYVAKLSYYIAIENYTPSSEFEIISDAMHSRPSEFYDQASPNASRAFKNLGNHIDDIYEQSREMTKMRITTENNPEKSQILSQLNTK